MPAPARNLQPLSRGRNSPKAIVWVKDGAKAEGVPAHSQSAQPSTGTTAPNSRPRPHWGVNRYPRSTLATMASRPADGAGASDFTEPAPTPAPSHQPCARSSDWANRGAATTDRAASRTPFIFISVLTAEPAPGFPGLRDRRRDFSHFGPEMGRRIAPPAGWTDAGPSHIFPQFNETVPGDRGLNGFGPELSR
jgi:hypothetical protein